MSMTAEERVNDWQERWGSSDDLTDEAFVDLIVTLRAHANAVLEAAAKVADESARLRDGHAKNHADCKYPEHWAALAAEAEDIARRIRALREEEE